MSIQTILAAGFCLLTCRNVNQMLRPESELPQFRFAARMQATIRE